MTIVLAQLISADGSFRNESKAWSACADDVRDVHNTPIPIRLDEHDNPPVGLVHHLERHPTDGSIWCVGRIDEDIDIARGTECYASVEILRNRDGTDVEITGLALVEATAMLGAWPATLIRDGLDQHGQATWRLGTFQQGLLERADTARYRRRTGEPLTIREADAPKREWRTSTTLADILHRNHPAELQQLAEDDAYARRARRVQRII
jgi:hypothetical protein